MPDLTFLFRDHEIPVSYLSGISHDTAQLALESHLFKTWVARCEREKDGKRIDLHSIEIQHVDLFGSRVGFVKINAESTLNDGITNNKSRLPGICFLRGGSVAVLVALICRELDGEVFSLLVDQPRIPIGDVSCLELPAGMIDSEHDGIAGTAAREMEEECGIKLRPSELTDLTELAGICGIAPSPGGCDEHIGYLYAERSVSKAELHEMKDRLSGLRDQGEYITLRVVALRDIWRISADNKAICALFLVEQLRKDGMLPPLGGLMVDPIDPIYRLSDRRVIPSLAFGLYNVPAGKEGVTVISNAIEAGYRNFDAASIYNNEVELGESIRLSGVPREEFFIATKVWNDAQKNGAEGVRQSVERSLRNLKCGYVDVMYVHWPVPGCFVETYKAIQGYHTNGLVRNIGLSNFGVSEYEEVMNSDGIHVKPAVNQIEISPFMYRPKTIKYFQDRGLTMVASKALHRSVGMEHAVVQTISREHGVTAAQVLLRWGIQKGFVVISKTASEERMVENRSVLSFALTKEDILKLDSLTSPEALAAREQLEIQRRDGI